MFESPEHYKNYREYRTVKKSVQSTHSPRKSRLVFLLPFSFFSFVVVTAFLYVGLQLYIGLLPGKEGKASHRSWSTEIADNGTFVGTYSAITLNGSNTPVIAYADENTTDIKVATYVGSSLGNCFVGSNWNCEVVDPGGGHSIDITTDGSGNPIISYLSSAPSPDGGLWAAQYVGSNGNCTSNTAWKCVLIDALTPGIGTSIAMKSSKPIISYATGTGTLKFAECTGADCMLATGWTLETVDNTASVGNYSSLVITSNGGNFANTPVISYFDDTNDNLKFANYSFGTGNCTGIGTNWNCGVVESTDSVGEWSSIIFSGTTSNTPVISYYDRTNGDLKLATYAGAIGTCNGANGFWDCSIVDTLGTGPAGTDVGRFTSMAKNGSGNLIISYTSFSSGGLLFAEYTGTGTETTCSSNNWSCDLVDSLVIAQYSSLVFDTTNSRALIAYYNDTNRDVKFASGSVANTAPVVGYTADNVIPTAQISQATIASGIISVNFKIKDPDSTTGFTLNTFQYSIDNGLTWNSPTNGDTTAALYVSNQGENWRNNNGGNYTAASLFSSATLHSFKWNVRHADISGIEATDQIDIRVRFTANDGTVNSSSPGTSEAFEVDVLAPVVVTPVNIVTRPTGGDTTVLLNAVFTESNPNTNYFAASLNDDLNTGNIYGQTNTSAPANQATPLTRTIDGDDCIDIVIAQNADDFSNATDSEVVSPALGCAVPYTPSAPGGIAINASSVRVVVGQNSAETGAVEYEISETTTNRFVQTNGSMGATAAWNTYTNWGGANGVTITGLSENTSYSFRTRTRNPNDANAVSGYSSSTSISTQTSGRRGFDSSVGSAGSSVPPDAAIWKPESGTARYPNTNTSYDVVLFWSDPVCEKAGSKLSHLSILRDHLPAPDVLADPPLKKFTIVDCEKSPERFDDTNVVFGTNYLYAIRSVNDASQTNLSTFLNVSVPPLFGYVKLLANHVVASDLRLLAMKGDEVNEETFFDFLPLVYERQDEPIDKIFGQIPKEDFVPMEKERREAFDAEMQDHFLKGEYTNLAREETEETQIPPVENNGDNSGINNSTLQTWLGVLRELTYQFFVEILQKTFVHAEENENTNYIIVGSVQDFRVAGRALPYASVLVQIYESGTAKLSKSVMVDNAGAWEVSFKSQYLTAGVHEIGLTVSFDKDSTVEVNIGVVYVVDSVESIEETTSEPVEEANPTENEEADSSSREESEEGEAGTEESSSEVVVQEEIPLSSEEIPPLVSAPVVVETPPSTEKPSSFGVNDTYNQTAIKEYEEALLVPVPEEEPVVERAERVKREFNIESVPRLIGELKKTYEKFPIPEEKVNPEIVVPFTVERLSRSRIVDPFALDIQNELYCKLSQVGTKFRLRNGRLLDESINEKGDLVFSISPRERDFLKERFWSGPGRLKLLEKMNYYFDRVRYNGGEVELLFRDLTEEERDELRIEAQVKTSQEIADFNTWLHLLIPSGKKFPKGISETMMLLGAEYCRYVPEPQLPQVKVSKIPAKKPLYTDRQGYLLDAPMGLNIDDAWSLPGGKGKNVRIVDVEGGWTIDHEDFPNLFYQKGNTDIEAFREHGTAVLGEMCGKPNEFGVSGIANEAQCGVVSFFGTGVPNAIGIAVSKVRPGDVLLVELQATGPASGEKCTCNCGQFEQIAMEFWQENFDIIQAATVRGTIVVAAAGNGSMNLDAPRYQGLFDKKKRDSGAILVGAGDSTTHDPHCWTNYGSRIDVQAWGDTVVTTGYGDLSEGTDAKAYYTEDFKGTSSAAPMIAGTAAVVQSIYYEKTGAFLTPLQMRELLRQNGTSPQGKSNKNIGSVPDAKKSIAALEQISKLKFADIKAPQPLPKGTPQKPKKVYSPTLPVDKGSPLFFLAIAGGILALGVMTVFLLRRKR
jgi:hypothetical protein